VQPLAVVGSLSRDLVDGGPPRPGGAVYHAARSLRVLGQRAVVVTKCARGDRSELLRRLIAFGLPVSWHPAESTTTFAFSYDEGVRQMTVQEIGDPWRHHELNGMLRDVRWLHVGALLRSDFTAQTLAALGRDRVLSLDGQALVRPAQRGPLMLDADFDPALLAHVRILKLSEEEATALLGKVDEPAVSGLGVREVVVTLGARGSIVFTGGRAERVSADPLSGIDPTGAGDAFAVAYLAARRSRHTPATAARRAPRSSLGCSEAN
jgi:sugar/nucleoside kinase (ribokinase family)